MLSLTDIIQMNDITYRSLTTEELYDQIKESPHFRNVNEQEYNDKLSALVEEGLIETSIDNDEETSLRLPANFVADKNELGKQLLTLDKLSQIIVFSLVRVVIRFWTIILGAQKTKTRQMINRIMYFLTVAVDSTFKRVPILFLMNDLEGKTQTSMRLIEDIITQYDARLYILSGQKKISLSDDFKQRFPDWEDRINCNSTADQIGCYVELYARGLRSQMPIIISLPNKTQVNKVCMGVYEKIKTISGVSHCTFIDEADEVYPQIRQRILKYIVQQDSTLATEQNDGVYFTTASHDDFIEKYPEVECADQLPINLEETVSEHYRDIDHPEARNPVKNLRQMANESNGAYVARVLKDYRSQFIHRNGICKNVIVHADFENSKQVTLAREQARRGFGCIVTNQSGFRIFYPVNSGEEPCEYVERNQGPLRDKPLNEKLFMIVQKHPTLRKCTLLVIGNKKIRRALTYHYAPRNNMTNGKSLIFTDIIVGHITNLAAAVQILGRIYGVIGHHPDYRGCINFWVDQRTREHVLHQTRVVRKIEENSVIPLPIRHLDANAREEVPDEEEVNARDIEQIGPYNTKGECIKELSIRLGREFPRGLSAFRQIDGYWISTKLGRADVDNVENLTKDHRIITNRKIRNSNVHVKQLGEIGPGNSVGPSTGLPHAQNYILLPAYENELSPETDSPQWYARYEKPMLDKSGNQLFRDNQVVYKENTYIIDSIEYSKYGIPTRAILKNLDGSDVPNLEPLVGRSLKLVSRL